MNQLNENDSTSDLLLQYWEKYVSTSLHAPGDSSAFVNNSPTEIRNELRLLIEKHKQLVANQETRTHGVSIPPQQLRLRIGEIINGIEVKEFINKGGIGEVYKGHDHKLGRSVAIKVMKLSGGQFKTIENEMKPLVDLKHDAIVTLYSTEKLPDGSYCAIMEFVDSGEGKSCSLKEFLKQEKTILGLKHNLIPDEGRRRGMSNHDRVKLVSSLMAPVAEGVAFAHSKGRIHRDIKPGNLLLSKPTSKDKLELILADWGLSKISKENGYSTFTVGTGTRAYIAPEVADERTQREPDERCDVFSFGVTLFETATGKLPEFLEDYTRGTSSAPSPELHPDFDLICKRCLEFEPDLRFESMDLVAQELHRIAEGAPIKSKPIGRLKRFVTGIQKSSTFIRSAIIVTLAAVALLAFQQIMRQRDNSVATSIPNKVMVDSVVANELRASAKAAFEANDLNLAESNLNDIVKAELGIASDFALLTKIQFRRHDFPKALKLSESATELDANLENRILHAQALTFSGQWESGLEEIDKLVEQFPRAVEPLAERAEINGFMGRWSQCHDDCIELLRVTPYRNDARFGIVMANAKAGEWQAQIDMTTKMLDINLTKPMARHFLAIGIAHGLCERMPKEEQQRMLTEFDKMWSHDDYYTFMIRGMLLYRIGRIEEAVTSLELAIERQEKGGTPYELCFLAMCKQSQGESADSIELLSKAKEAFTRLRGPFPRPLFDIDPSLVEIGTTTCWHQVARYEVCLKETTRKLTRNGE